MCLKCGGPAFFFFSSGLFPRVHAVPVQWRRSQGAGSPAPRSRSRLLAVFPSQAVDGFLIRAAERELDGAAVALLDSQSGPFAARVRTARPTSAETSLAGPHAGAAAPKLGHAGATVALNVLVRDLNPLQPARMNGGLRSSQMAFPFGAAPKSPSTAAGPPRREGGSAVAALRMRAPREAPHLS